jgi:hypothetical protein
VVILPLKEWEKMREYIEELEKKKKYLKAFKEGKGKKDNLKPIEKKI